MSAKGILTTADVGAHALCALLERWGLSLEVLADGEEITASYWGDCEAGVVGTTVYVRNDTPVHSLLHEACHVLCMDDARRKSLHGDAGGDDLEEAAVCYLQVVLADLVDDVDPMRLMRDMDAWGYSFRLGSTRRWFEHDADDARAWLCAHGLLTAAGRPTFRRRI